MEGECGIGPGASGEDGKIELKAQLFQDAGPGHPFFAQNKSIGAIAKEDRLKVILDIPKGDLDAGLGADMVRELPIVVPPALVFVFLDLLAGQIHAREVLHGARDGFAIAFGDVHQDAIHVKHDELLVHWFQMSSRAASRRRVCSRVPTVIRTHPAAS